MSFSLCLQQDRPRKTTTSHILRKELALKPQKQKTTKKSWFLIQNLLRLAEVNKKNCRIWKTPQTIHEKPLHPQGVII